MEPHPAPASTVALRPKLDGLLPEEDDDPRPATKSLEIPAGASLAVRVEFDAVSAYMASCDRFAIRVRFEVNGEKLAPIADLHVMRMEPIRR